MTFLSQIAPIAAILTAVSAGLIVITEDERARIGLLGVQYVCVTILASFSIPFQIALIKLVSGGSVILILYATAKQRGWERASTTGSILPSGRLFRMIAVLLVSTAAVGIGRSSLFVSSQLDPAVIASALLLGALGLLQLGLLYQPIEIAIGLLTLLNGFEIIYTPLENSLAILGLLAAVQVGIALSISIVVLDTSETTED
jgi:hypothetical protein